MTANGWNGDDWAITIGVGAGLVVSAALWWLLRSLHVLAWMTGCVPT